MTHSSLGIALPSNGGNMRSKLVFLEANAICVAIWACGWSQPPRKAFKLALTYRVEIVKGYLQQDLRVIVAFLTSLC